MCLGMMQIANKIVCFASRISSFFVSLNHDKSVFTVNIICKKSNIVCV